MALKELNKELKQLNEDINDDQDWNEYTDKVKNVWSNIKDLMKFMEEKEFINNEEYPMIDKFYDELANINNWLNTNFGDSEEE